MDQARPRARHSFTQRRLRILRFVQIAAAHSEAFSDFDKTDHAWIGRFKHVLLIEQALLLMHQAQRLVVHQDHFDVQAVFGGSGHLLNIHHQTAVAGEADNLAIRLGQCGADCRRQPKAHGAQTA